MKKLLVLLIMLTSVFTLTGCDNATGLEDHKELKEALDNMEGVENFSIKIRSEIVDVLSIELYTYTTSEHIKTYMPSTSYTYETIVYGVINGDNLEILELVPGALSGNTYMTTSVESISETETLYEDMDLYENLKYTFEDGYYIAKDVNLELPGYEEVEEIPELKLKVEDGYLTEIIIVMEIEDQEILVTVEMFDIGTTVIEMPEYYDTVFLDDINDRFAEYDCDNTITMYGFDVSSLVGYVQFQPSQYAIELEGLANPVEYFPSEGVFMTNGSSYDIDQFFSTFTDTGFTKESWLILLEVYEIYN